MSSEGFAVRFPQRVEEFDALAADWERLAAQAGWYVPPFVDLRREMEADPGAFCLAVATGADGVEGIACLRRSAHRQRFAIGERQVAEVPTRACVLPQGAAVGAISEAAWGEAFQRIFRHGKFDMLGLGEVPIGSPLMRAVERVRAPLLPLGLKDREAVHWLIALPGSFEQYLNGLRKSTKQSLRRKINAFERQVPNRLEVISRPEQVGRFLAEGEGISRQTYQWDVGQRLEDDPATRERYTRLAGEGRLRCYMLYAEDKPIAFLRGEFAGSLYHYETPGFVPEYERHSPGLVLLAYAIRDLIENTPCTLFDFGTGGDQVGYKSRFGTHHIDCLNLSIVNARTPRGLAVWTVGRAVGAVKAAGRAVLGDGELKRRIKKAIRRYDAPAPSE